MPTERDTGVDELGELRRRAYGPHADIATDPVAQARLHELEAVERETRSVPEFTGMAVTASDTTSEAVLPPRPTPPVEEPAAIADDPAAPPAESVAPSLGTEAPSDVGRNRQLRSARKRMPWLIAVVTGSVAVVAVIALVVGEVSRPNPEMSLPSRILPSTVGKPDLSSPMRRVWGIPDAPVVYRGTIGRLDLWTTTDRSQWDCILLSSHGQVYRASCSHRPLPAMVDFVTENATLPPESLDPVIPVGSFLRLIWEGDLLNVYVARLEEADVRGAPTVR